jgi:hypothetical protein
VHGNALRTKTLTVKSYLNNIRVVASARIAQGGDLVYVYRQASHGAKGCIFNLFNTERSNNLFLSL